MNASGDERSWDRSTRGATSPRPSGATAGRPSGSTAGLALGESVAAIRRRYGAGERPGSISTGSGPLDHALGGGWPRGAISELSGEVGTGKSTLALCAAASVLEQGGSVVWIDAEGAFPAGLARSLDAWKTLGGPADPSHARLAIVPPDAGDVLYAIACDLVAGGAVDLVVLDSAAAIDLVDGEERGRCDDDGRYRLHGDAARRLAHLVRETGATFLAIDQRRDRPGATFGPRDQPAAGRSLGQVAAVRVALEPIEDLVRGGGRVGQRVLARIVAHRYGAASAVARLALRDGRGPWHACDLVERALSQGLAPRDLGIADLAESSSAGRDRLVDALEADPGRAAALAARLEGTR